MKKMIRGINTLIILVAAGATMYGQINLSGKKIHELPALPSNIVDTAYLLIEADPINGKPYKVKKSSLIAGASGVVDGNKGDITVSGLSWTINGSSVQNGKLATMANNTIKGNVSGTTASPQDITTSNLATVLGIDAKMGYADTASLSNRINSKQATLISGTNIRTINGNTLLGSTDLVISGSFTWGNATGDIANETELVDSLRKKQDTIPLGTTSQYYRGDKTWQTLNKTAVGLANVDNTSDLDKPISNATNFALSQKQAQLVSGTNIKTINNLDLLGSGNISVSTDTTYLSNRINAISGGGGGSLQDVTEIGNITTDSIIIGTNDDITNTDTIQASGYEAIATGSPNLGAVQNLYLFFDAQRTRIRQTGAITKIQMYFASKPGTLTGFYFDVWRKNGLLYDSVCHINILPLISGGSVNTITLPRSVDVEVGDYIGCSWTSSSAPSDFIQYVSTAGAANYTTSPPGWSSYDWAAATTFAGYIPIHVFMRAPNIVSIGNSLTSGYPTNYTFIETTENNEWETTVVHKLANTLYMNYQNMGIGGETTSNILARFHDDVILAHPNYAILEGGINDIASNVPISTIKSNWNAMIDSCVSNDIIPVVMMIYPWSAGNTTQMQKVDSINAYLDSLCNADYPTAIVVDVRSDIGMYRAGGSPGNLWDIKGVYNYGDNVHLNESGNTKVAEAIASLLPISGNTIYYNGSIQKGGDIFRLPSEAGTIYTDKSFGLNNIGIGTSIPETPLHIKSNNYAEAGLLLENTNGGEYAYSQLQMKTTSNIYNIGVGNSTETNFGVAGDFYVFDNTNGAMRLVISNSGNVGIGTVSPSSTAILDVTSTTKGFLPPRMTATQGSAISSPAEGLMIYVTDTNGTFTAKGWWGYDGSAWQKLNN